VRSGAASTVLVQIPREVPEGSGADTWLGSRVLEGFGAGTW